MRKFLFSLAMITIMAACNTNPDSYTITGTLIGDVADGTSVFLKKGGDNRQLVDIDTVQVQQGKFVFEGTTDHPEIHYLFVGEIKGYFSMVLENGAIEVEAHRDSLGLANIHGTPQNDFLMDYLEKSKEASQKGMNIQEDLQNAKMSGDTVLINSLQEELNELREEYDNSKIDYIKANPNALVSALLIESEVSTRTRPLEELKALYDNLTPEIKATDAAKKLAKILEEQLKIEASAKDTNIGAIAPNFSAPTPAGDLLALNDIKGKATLIDFWAAWCRPCRAENPNVVKVYNKYHDKGLNIIGVSLDRTAEAWKKAIEDDGLMWNHVSNISYFDDAIAKLYNVRAIPAAFLLDKNGVIVAKDLRGPALEEKVAELLQ